MSGSPRNIRYIDAIHWLDKILRLPYQQRIEAMPEAQQLLREIYERYEVNRKPSPRQEWPAGQEVRR